MKDSIKRIARLSCAAAIGIYGCSSKAQTYDTNSVVVQTFAGSGFAGYVDGQGALTMFNQPNAIVADSHNNLFVWDSGNRRIRKIAPDSTVSTFVGGGANAIGVGTNVSLSYSHGFAIDHSDTILMDNRTLYRITEDSTVTTTGWKLPELVGGICADSKGNIYFSDEPGRKIYQYKSNGISTVFAGSGNTGYADGNGIFTAFDWPSALAADAADNIYVWDRYNNVIRKIDQTQNVTTVAGRHNKYSSLDGFGTNAFFAEVMGMAFDDLGNLVLACGSCIRRVSPAGVVTTIAGSFSETGFADGTGNLARFDGASGVCVSQGTIFVADSGNQRIRSIRMNTSPQPVSPANLELDLYPGLRITGTVGRTYQIESSPDMSTWTTVMTLVLPANPYLWIDQRPATGNSFYRALLLP